MQSAFRLALITAALCLSAGAQAQSSLNLGNYQVTGNHTLASLGGMGLEASAVATR